LYVSPSPILARGYEVTDEDIHNPVYDLYGLTEEERKIMKEVDNSSLRTELR